MIVAMGVVFVAAPFIPRLAASGTSRADAARRAQRAGARPAPRSRWPGRRAPARRSGAIVTAAGTSGSAAHGAFLLAVYCAGLGVPFLITGLAFGTATSALTVVKRHYPIVIGVGGAVLIAMGVLIWTGEFTQLNITVRPLAATTSGCRTSTPTPRAAGASAVTV